MRVVCVASFALAFKKKQKLKFSGEGAGEDLSFALLTLEVGVESYRRAVGVLEGLVGLEGFAQGLRGDKAYRMVFYQVV